MNLIGGPATHRLYVGARRVAHGGPSTRPRTDVGTVVHARRRVGAATVLRREAGTTEQEQTKQEEDFHDVSDPHVGHTPASSRRSDRTVRASANSRSTSSASRRTATTVEKDERTTFRDKIAASS
jgi:hypothetical protein